MLWLCGCRFLCCRCVVIGAYVGVYGCRCLCCRCVGVEAYVVFVWV